MCLGTHFICDGCQIGMFRYAIHGRCDSEGGPDHRWLGTLEYIGLCRRCRRIEDRRAYADAARVAGQHEAAKAVLEFLHGNRPVPYPDEEMGGGRHIIENAMLEQFRRGYSIHPYIPGSPELEARQISFRRQAVTYPDNLLIRGRFRVFEECIRRQNEINATRRQITAEDQRYSYDMIIAGNFVVAQYRELRAADRAAAGEDAMDIADPQQYQDQPMQDDDDDADASAESSDPDTYALSSDSDVLANNNGGVGGQGPRQPILPLGGFRPIASLPRRPAPQNGGIPDFLNELALIMRIRGYYTMLNNTDPHQTINRVRLQQAESLALRALARGTPLVASEVRAVGEAFQWTAEALQSYHSERLAVLGSAPVIPVYQGMNREQYIETFNELMDQGQPRPSNSNDQLDPDDSPPEDEWPSRSGPQYVENGRILINARNTDRRRRPPQPPPRDPREAPLFSTVLFNHRTGEYFGSARTGPNDFSGFPTESFNSVGGYTIYDD